MNPDHVADSVSIDESNASAVLHCVPVMDKHLIYIVISTQFQERQSDQMFQ